MSEQNPDRPHLGSTYRLQLRGLGFAGAANLVPYLDELGIETLYCSPILRAVPGSTHGYDVADPTELDPALGGPDDFEGLLCALAAHRMRLLIDIVPNHLAAHPSNPWWWDVLRLGRQSAYAPVFDIDWEAQGDKVLLPTLSEPLSAVLSSGRGAEIVAEQGQAELHLDHQRFPVAPTTAPPPGALCAEQALALHAEQHYRLAHWRLGADEGNYRRFFDIDGLIGVRVEDPAVFNATQAFLLSIGGDERVAGFRVDHVDGLARPGRYLHQLRQALAENRRSAAAIVVEKIVGADEGVPSGWPIDGTTGYEFADVAGAMFVAPDDSDSGATFGELAHCAKRDVMAAAFGSSCSRVVTLCTHALDRQTPGHDLSRSSLQQAVTALTVQLDVYRTYLTDEGLPRPIDADRIAAAARRAEPSLGHEATRALRAVASGLAGGGPLWSEVVQRWEQLTGAIMAKGVEDTATYRTGGFLGHAEVGSTPGRPALAPAEFAAIVTARSQTHPHSLNTTSTHDSKRSEDVRARLYALSEWASEWWTQVADWRAATEWIGRHGGPDLWAQHFCYQTLVAVWPADRGSLGDEETTRVEQYIVKAAREAKQQTSWHDPDETYEATLMAFVRHLSASPSFCADATAWVGRIGPAAAVTSLALIVLKVICPGTPDVYQGNEVWEFALTDPDNRRPVNFGHRSLLLQNLVHAQADPHPMDHLADLLGQWSDGRLKLHVLRTLLVHRRQRRSLFADGSFSLLEVRGSRADHVIALARQHEDQWVVALLPRLMRSVGVEGSFALGPRSWGDTTVLLPRSAPPRLADLLTGQTHSSTHGGLELAAALNVLPIAVLSTS